MVKECAHWRGRWRYRVRLHSGEGVRLHMGEDSGDGVRLRMGEDGGDIE